MRKYRRRLAESPAPSCAAGWRDACALILAVSPRQLPELCPTSPEQAVEALYAGLSERSLLAQRLQEHFSGDAGRGLTVSPSCLGWKWQRWRASHELDP